MKNKEIIEDKIISKRPDYIRSFIDNYTRKVVTIFIIAFACISQLEAIETFICKNFLFQANEMNLGLHLIFWPTLIFTIVFIRVLLSRKYSLSFYQIVFIIANLVLFSIFRFEFFERNWDYYTIFQNVAYLDLLLYPWGIYIGICIYNSYKNSGNTDDECYICEDSPIKNLADNNSFNNKKLVNSIVTTITSGTYQKANSIGIIGSWGNGKSSLINCVKHEIKTKHQDIINIEFHPFLNHDEKSIIDEFFKAFQEELKKYDGQISNSIINYADLLLSQYSQGSIKKIFNLPQGSSAHSRYLDINKSLKRIDKKIVVYVDDLDRLNGIEIYQVLKLIRNTANFYNTIFLVAVDKEYVVNALKVEKAYQNHTFIDKFFQLEIFLPEIQVETLKMEFVNILKNSQLNDNVVVAEIERALTKDTCLFTEANNNIRDIKRLASLIVFENILIGRPLDYTDYLNYLILKLKFPRVIEVLYNHRNKIFETLSDGYILKRTNPDVEDLVNPKEATISINKGYNPDFDDYQITCKKDKEGNWFRDLFSISEIERELLNKLLIVLWGRAYITSKSIQSTYNFHKLMRLGFAAGDLKEGEFERLLTFNNNEDSISFAQELFKSGKVIQALKRISDNNTKPKDKAQFFAIISFLIHSLINKDKYAIPYNSIIDCLGKWILPPYWLGKDRIIKKNEIKEVVMSQLFKSVSIDLDIKLYILFDLWANKDDNNLWGLEKLDIISLGNSFFAEVISSENDWGTIISVYTKIIQFDKSIKSFCNDKVIKKINQSISDFLPHAIIADESKAPTFFKLNPFVKDVFGSNFEFYKLLEKHQSTEDVKEAFKFITLLLIINFERSLIYRFNAFKINKLKNNLKFGPDQEVLAQIIIQFNDQTIFEHFTDDWNRNINNQIATPDHIKVGGYDILIFQFNYIDENTLETLPRIFEHFLSRNEILSKISTDKDRSSVKIVTNELLQEGPLVISHGIDIIKVLSIQPKVRDGGIR